MTQLRNCPSLLFISAWSPMIQISAFWSYHSLIPSKCAETDHEDKTRANHSALIRSFGGHPRVSPVHRFAMVGSQMYGFLSYAKQSCRSSYLFLLVLEFLKWCLSTRIMQEEILLWIIHLDIPFNRTINHKKRQQKRAVWQNFLLECTHINNFPIYHHNIL